MFGHSQNLEQTDKRQNLRGTIFCSKIEMVQLLGQRQRIVVNPSIDSAVGEAFEINVDYTRSITGGTISNEYRKIDKH